MVGRSTPGSVIAAYLPVGRPAYRVLIAKAFETGKQ